MRVLLYAAIVLLVGCSSGEQEAEIHHMSVDVDLSSLSPLLTAVDQVTDGELDVEHLLEFTNSVPMDDEIQEQIPVSYKGGDTEVFYHVWREQVDWVHLYVSGPSRELIAEIDKVAKPFAREDSAEE